MFFDIRRTLTAVGRHVNGYVDLVEAEASAAMRSVKERVVLMIIGLMAAWLAVALAVLWIVAATWNGSYRLWVIAGLFAAFALAAAIAIAAAGRHRKGLFERLRAEWSADRTALFNEDTTGERHGRRYAR